jgi:signal transduction histidine kinase/CheY-like chemotaxis protein
MKINGAMNMAVERTQAQSTSEGAAAARRPVSFDAEPNVQINASARQGIHWFLIISGWVLIVVNVLNLALLQWLPQLRSDHLELTSITSWEASLAFLLSGLAILIYTRRDRYHSLGVLGHIIGSLVALIGLYRLSSLFGWADFFSANISHSAQDFLYPAPNTAGFIIAIGGSLALLDWNWSWRWSWRRRRIRLSVSAILALVCVFGGLLACLGHAYDVLPFYAVSLTNSPMHVASALEILLIGLNILVLRDDTLFSRYLLLNSPGGDLARLLLPTVILVPLILGWLKQCGQRFGLFDEHSGRMLFILTLMMSTAVLIRWFVQSLDAIDRQRRLAEKARRKTEKESVATITRSNQMLSLTALELIATRNAALDCVRKKDRALATMTHELITPMNAVIGASELLDGAQIDSGSMALLVTIKTAGQALLDIINDILIYAKLESSKITLETIDFDPVELIESAVDIVSLKTDEKGVVLLSFISPALPPLLKGDPARLREVVLNLLSNAAKFTTSGTIQVVATPRIRQGRQFLEISVRDTGSGITPAQLPHLFQPFVQADSSVSEKFAGSGLGLYISRRLVELMGGEILVTSAPNTGSVFTIMIPLVVPEGVAKSIQLMNSSGKQETADHFALVVGPHQAVAHNLMRYLRGFGIDAAHTVHLMRALTLLDRQSQANKVVFLLPEMVSPELIDRLSAPGRKQFLVATGRKEGERLARLFKEYEVFRLQAPFKQDNILQLFGLSRVRPQAVFIDKNVGGQSQGGLYPMSVLEVEDNELNRQILVMQLEKLGCLVQSAANGSEAIPLILSGQFDLVLMDCRMPAMDGMDVTKYVRELERVSGRHTPIVAMTAATMPGDKEKCLAAGMDDYIAKPITYRSLSDLIGRWYKSTRLSA